MKCLNLALAILLAVTAGRAATDTFTLTYSFTFGPVLEAQITGDLQEDGDTVIVTAIENARLDGTPGPALPFVTSLSDLAAGTDENPPVLTLSGQRNDISACSDTTCTADFITLDGVKQFFGEPGIFTSPAFGDTMSGGANATERYDPANYKLTPR